MVPARSLAKPRFATDESGTIALVFGLAFMVFVFAAGMGIDYARVMDTKSRVAAAADAAALAAGRALQDGRLSEGDVVTAAQQFFAANLKNGATPFGTITSFAASVDRDTGAVTITTSAEVRMTLTSIAGFDKLSFPITSSAKFDQYDIELSMALDVTGSMMGSKIAALKSATSDLVDIMLPDGGTANKVRIALAPYSSGVNAGTLAPAATGNHSTGCTFEREGADPLGDQAPSYGNYLKAPGFGVGAGVTCPPTAKVIALTDDKRALKSSVSAYTAQGSTAGHVGVAWASYLVSPEWAGVVGSDSAPVAYRDGKTIKAVVLMSDGLFNTVGGVNYGDGSRQGAQSQTWAKGICKDLRDHGVVVYTVGFKLSEIYNRSHREAAAGTLLDCAGSAQRFFDADDPDALRQAFVAIANQLNNLRLTH